MADRSGSNKWSRSPCHSSSDSGQGRTAQVASLESFTKLEQFILQAAAETLGTNVETIIAAARASPTTPSSSDGLSESDLSPSGGGDLALLGIPFSNNNDGLPVSPETFTESGGHDQLPFTTPKNGYPDTDSMNTPYSEDIGWWISTQDTLPTAGHHWDVGIPMHPIQVAPTFDASWEPIPAFPTEPTSNDLFPALYTSNMPINTPSSLEATIGHANLPWPCSVPNAPGTSSLVSGSPGYSNNRSTGKHPPHNLMLDANLPNVEMTPLTMDYELNYAFNTGAQTLRAQGTQLDGRKSRIVNRTSRKKRQRGPYQDQAKRRETHLTRTIGACITCSLKRHRCIPDPENPDGCCITCIKGAAKRIYYTPCWRYNISEAVLLDHAECPRPAWTVRWKKMEVVDINDWASDEVKTVSITQDVFNNQYNLKVRKFIPQEGDALERRWKTNGVEQSFRCAPYAIANMTEAGQTLASYADRTLDSSINFYVDGDDKLLHSTYSMAHIYSTEAKHPEERQLLKSALRLWCASRMESHSDRICGEETLGMRPKHYEPKSINDGNVLLPPVLSAQVEIIVTSMILKPAQKDVLKRLRKLMEKTERCHWFSIYLCIFIILHSCALLTAGDNKKARKQGLDPEKHRFFRPRVVEELHNGAKILLAWFHNANKGSRPFSQDWDAPDQFARSELSKEQGEFMKDTVQNIKLKASHFQRIKNERAFEDQYFFLAQLYDPDWKPAHTI